MKSIPLICASLIAAASAQAGSLTPELKTTGATPIANQKPMEFCKRFKEFLTFYKDKSNPYIQEIKLTSRQQYQWGGTSGDNTFAGGRDWTSEWRRFRLGAEVKFLERFKLVNVWNIGGLESRGSYDKANKAWNSSQTEGDIYELYLEYNQPKLFNVTAGKLKSRMTAEYRTSSSKIRTVERSSLVNQLRADTSWGAQFSNPGKDDKFQWVAGVFASCEDGKYGSDPEWQSGYGLLTLSYDASNVLLKKGRFWLDYTTTNQDMADIGLEHSYRGMKAKNFWSLSYEGSQDNWYLLADVMFGRDLAQKTVSGQQASNAFGITILPTYDITPWMQGVFRYQYAQAPGGGLKLDSRYYGTLSPDTKFIDSFNAFYLGLNFFLCPKEPDLAKLMVGAEYMASSSAKPGQDAFNGWMYYVSLRTNF